MVQVLYWERRCGAGHGLRGEALALFASCKAQFEAALREESAMQVKVYRTIIDVLSAKLNNDNVRVRDY